ncbi:MAG: IS630 family transposase [Candidatus Methylomirabilales bacterium]
MRSDINITVSAEELSRLAAVVADGKSPQKHVWRARIILLTADGCGTMEIMRRTGKSKPTVWRWQRRFMEAGVAGLLRDKTRPPGKPPLPAETVARVVALTLQEPPRGRTQWTSSAMAEAVGISVTSVLRIWKAHGLRPHKIKTFKLSKDPRFAEKVHDIVGLYVDPPDHAVVLSVDEKSQIQALDRSQPGLPLKPGRCGTMTHDYKRSGTATLFAALDVLEGKVIGQCMTRHRHQEFIRFLNTVNRKTPKDRKVHLIVDNYGTHKHPKAQAWFERHPRFYVHFTPTGSSWLNAVETFFSKLTRHRLKRGVFCSVAELCEAINRYIETHNENPKPFVWTADPNRIIEKVIRGKQALESIH